MRLSSAYVAIVISRFEPVRALLSSHDNKKFYIFRNNWSKAFLLMKASRGGKSILHLLSRQRRMPTLIKLSNNARPRSLKQQIKIPS